jgi:hypothetical protein
MSWQVKYYFHYRDINNAQYTINVLENSSETLTPAMCIPGEAYPTLGYVGVTHKFVPVRGSILNFSLLAETDGAFEDLYTEDMKKYKVNHYKGAILIGSYYMDSELFSEPFSDIDNYSISFTCNDGFNLLDRISYMKEDETKYEGIVSQWTVITNILSKLALDWKFIFVGLSTTITGVTQAAGETIFHKQYVIQENYYNEDGDAESCRKVLESILEPYGAFIEQKFGTLYISDLSYIDAEDAKPFRVYNATTFEYINTQDVNLHIGDISDIEYASTESTKEIQAGFNKQVIVYSPYRDIDFLKWAANQVDFNTELSTTANGSGEYTWNETLYDYSIYWNKFNQGKFAKATATAGSKNGETKYYLKIGKYAFGSADESKKSYTWKKQLPYVIPSAGYYLRIDIEAMFRTKINYDDSSEVGKKLTYGVLFLKIKIGDKVYVRFSGPDTWQTEQTGGHNWFYLEYFKKIDYKLYPRGDGSYSMVYTYGEINDQYLTANNQNMFADRSIVTSPILIPLASGFAGGVLELSIYNWTTGDGVSLYQDETATNNTLDCRIDKVELTVTDSNGNAVENDDIEYEKSLDLRYKNARDNVSLIHGTNVTGIPFERGGVMGYNGTNYYYLQSWTREGFTSTLENLLLRSILSNYKNASAKLSCTLNLVNNLFGYITYNNYLLGKKLMITECTIDYGEATADLVLTEFNKDNLPLNT